MKSILKCPSCEYQDGVPQSLAELLPTGEVIIRRSRKTWTGEHETTVVSGENFTIRCGRCNEVVFRKAQELETMQIGTIGTITQIYQTFNASIGSIVF